MENENQKDYEIAFALVSPETAKELENVLTQQGAEIFYKSPVAEIRLAYPIKKHASAQFGFYYFKANGDAISKIKEALNLNPNVLRFLIVTPPVKLAGVVPQSRPERKPTPLVSNEMLEGKLEEMLK